MPVTNNNDRVMPPRANMLPGKDGEGDPRNFSPREGEEPVVRTTGTIIGGTPDGAQPGEAARKGELARGSMAAGAPKSPDDLGPTQEHPQRDDVHEQRQAGQTLPGAVEGNDARGKSKGGEGLGVRAALWRARLVTRDEPPEGGQS